MKKNQDLFKDFFKYILLISFIGSGTFYSAPSVDNKENEHNNKSMESHHHNRNRHKSKIKHHQKSKQKHHKPHHKNNK